MLNPKRQEKITESITSGKEATSKHEPLDDDVLKGIVGGSGNGNSNNNNEEEEAVFSGYSLGPTWDTP